MRKLMAAACRLSLLLVAGMPAAHASANAMPEQPAVEILFVRPQPSVPMLSTPAANGIVVRQLSPGDRVTVLGRQAGFVNVQAADGVQGWLGETALTRAAPPAARVTELEQDLEQLRGELAAAQGRLRTTQARLRQAEESAAAARASGSDRSAQLEAANRDLQSALDAATARAQRLEADAAQLRLAQQAAQLLAARQPTGAALESSRFSRAELASAAAAALALVLAGAWFGAARTRRRLRQRYHGMEL